MAIQDAEALDSPFCSAGLRVRRRLPISRAVFLDLLLVVDALVITGGAFAAVLVTVTEGLSNAAQVIPGGSVALAGSAVAFGAIALVLIRPISFKRLMCTGRSLGDVLAGWSVVMFTAGALVYFVAAPTAGIPVAAWWGFSALGFVAIRFAASYLVKRWMQEGRLARQVAIYGQAPHTRLVLEWLSRQPFDEMAVAGVFGDQRALSVDATPTPVDGSLEDLVAAARDGRFDQVMLAFSGAAEEKLREAISVLRQLPVDVYWPFDLICGGVGAIGARRLNGRTCLHIERKPFSDWRAFGKWVEDKVLASLFLAAAAPIMGLIAVAIRLDSPGPILFRQPRFGFNNTEIVIYKFRTMYAHLGDVSGATQTTERDLRVTRSGRWLRSLNLDELPQLVNVLQGRLSLVGPRPHALRMKAANRLYHEAVDDYAARHRVKPGITGWAQVNGLRGPTKDLDKAERRIEYDLYYIDNWSVWFDFKIIALTGLRGFTDPNAL